MENTMDYFWEQDIGSDKENQLNTSFFDDNNNDLLSSTTTSTPNDATHYQQAGCDTLEKGLMVQDNNLNNNFNHQPSFEPPPVQKGLVTRESNFDNQFNQQPSFETVEKGLMAQDDNFDNKFKDYVDCGGEKRDAIFLKTKSHKPLRYLVSPLLPQKKRQKRIPKNGSLAPKTLCPPQEVDDTKGGDSSIGSNKRKKMDTVTEEPSNGDEPAMKKTQTTIKNEAEALLKRIHASDAVQENRDAIFDNCLEVKEKIVKFLEMEGMSKAAFLRTLKIHPTSLNRFLKVQGAREQCGNITYTRGYYFLEKLRIDRNEPKSESRLRNESLYPSGFCGKRDNRRENSIKRKNKYQLNVSFTAGSGQMC